MSGFLEQRKFLEPLRKFADCSDVQWGLVLDEVEAVGLARLPKTMTELLLKTRAAAAREGVLKHPGHGNQSVHGNGGSGGRGADARNSGQPDPMISYSPTDVGDVAAAQATVSEIKAMNSGRATYSGASEMASGAQKIANAKDFASARQIAINEDNAIAASLRGGRAKSDSGLEGMNRAFAARFPKFPEPTAFTNAELSAQRSGRTSVANSADPVLKHPGHANQASHGNGGSGSRSGSPAGGTQGQSAGGMSYAQEDLNAANRSAGQIAEQHLSEVSDEGRPRLSAKHNNVQSSLSGAQTSLELAGKTQGAESKKHLRDAKEQASEARNHMDSAFRSMGSIPRGRAVTQFEDALSSFDSVVSGLLD
jgi:hypothetical protein